MILKMMKRNTQSAAILQITTSMVGNLATNRANNWAVIGVSKSNYSSKLRGLEVEQRMNLTKMMQDEQRLADQVHTETHSGTFSVEYRIFGLPRGRLNPLITADILHECTGDPADGYVDVYQAQDFDSYCLRFRHIDVQT
jgi:hypothetical protein